jgi:hypothetical protein
MTACAFQSTQSGFSFRLKLLEPLVKLLCVLLPAFEGLHLFIFQQVLNNAQIAHHFVNVASDVMAWKGILGLTAGKKQCDQGRGRLSKRLCAWLLSWRALAT